MKPSRESRVLLTNHHSALLPSISSTSSSALSEISPSFCASKSHCAAYRLGWAGGAEAEGEGAGAGAEGEGEGVGRARGDSREVKEDAEGSDLAGMARGEEAPEEGCFESVPEGCLRAGEGAGLEGWPREDTDLTGATMLVPEGKKEELEEEGEGGLETGGCCFFGER